MSDYDGPVLDDHLHLHSERGRGVDAVEAFAAVGGTHLLVVNLPSWHYGAEAADDGGAADDDGAAADDDGAAADDDGAATNANATAAVPETAEDFRAGFEATIDVVERASEVLPGRAWPVLGVHPGLISKLVDDRGVSAEEARERMQAGIDVAAEYVADGPGLALKSGRPHYDVSAAVWDASNAVMRHAFERGAELGCAVQLHAEAGEDFEQVGEWAEDAGLPRQRVVKHYAEGRVDGVVPSVKSETDRLRRAAERDDPFLMETDYLDDPDRPGAVLGPKTVPRRVDWLLEAGFADAVRRAHVETPASVYGIDTEATLAE